MTRYARAKGSKASNERIPNDATPWHVMKKQLVENLCKKQESSEKTKSVKELLEDKQSTVTTNGIENAYNSWAEFPNNTKQENNLITNKVKKIQKTELKRKPDENNTDVDIKLSLKRNINEIDSSVIQLKNKKYKESDYPSDNISNNRKNQIDTKLNKSNTLIDKLNVKRKKDKHNTSEGKKNKNDTVIKVDEFQNEKDTFSKRQKRNMKRKKSLNNSTSDSRESNVNNDIVSQDINDNKNESNRTNQATRFNKNFMTKSHNFRNIPNNISTRKFNNQKIKRKPPKIRDDKEYKRRKPDLGPSKIIINDMEVEIVKFDGFPVKKEDADRLTDLKQKMIMKGIPQTEINAAMKLERRKAEKALARIRKCVCFHCRKAGHNLSDCPELGSEQAGTGICFKCGSTEHTHFECKVAKPTEFRYATCFICREQGHIAKQCPDNPKGVYPQGGACKICGDVTHLKKDCPDLIKEKEENTITVNTIADDNLESLEENTNRRDIKDNKKTKNIVKF